MENVKRKDWGTLWPKLVRDADPRASVKAFESLEPPVSQGKAGTW